MPSNWTPRDEVKFCEGIKRLTVIFGRTADTELLAVYRHEMRDLDGDQACAGLSKCVRESKFWPSIAEVRDRAGANNVAEMQQRIAARGASTPRVGGASVDGLIGNVSRALNRERNA